jgi:hypothetical protein
MGMMEKRNVEVAGYPVTQLNETEYEAENPSQDLDFYFDAGREEAVEVFVFDSKLPTKGTQDPCITAFYAEDLEDAVVRAMSLRRESFIKSQETDVINASEVVH